MFIMKLVTPPSFLLPVGLSEPCLSLTPSNASPSLPYIPFQSISSTNPNISDQSPASLCDIPHFSRGFQSIQCQGLAPVSHTWTQLDHPRIENSLIQEHIKSNTKDYSIYTTNRAPRITLDTTRSDCRLLIVQGLCFH